MADSAGDEDAIRALLDRRIDAMRRKDAEAAIATLTEDVVSFELAPPLALGPAQARDVGALRGWFASWSGPVEIEMRDLVIEVGGNAAWCRSLNRLSGTRSDGRQVGFWMRSTLGLRKSGDEWRIAHGHSSVPLLMDGSYRGAMDLEP